jgi:hypothetical protein
MKTHLTPRPFSNKASGQLSCASHAISNRIEVLSKGSVYLLQPGDFGGDFSIQRFPRNLAKVAIKVKVKVIVKSNTCKNLAPPWRNADMSAENGELREACK